MHNTIRPYIKFNKEVFRDRLDLFIYFCKLENQNFPIKVFLHSNYYYVRAALENKFNRQFSFEEVKEILKDKTWQWRTSSQTSVFKG